MTCRDYMISNPPTLAADTTVGEAASLLTAQRLFALPVADSTGIYVGMFGVYDVIGLLLPSGAAEGLVPDLGFMADDPGELRDRLAEQSGRPIGPLLRDDLPTLSPENPIVEALFLLHKHRHPLAVVDADRRLVGLMTHWEALAALSSRPR
jgi:CBS domain-containing protein